MTKPKNGPTYRPKIIDTSRDDGEVKIKPEKKPRNDEAYLRRVASMGMARSKRPEKTYSDRSTLYGLEKLSVSEIIPHPVSGLGGHVVAGVLPWDRQTAPNGVMEEMSWYARFEAFRSMGPARTLRGLFKAFNGNDLNTAWYKVAAIWQWHARAEAWDMYEIEWFRASEMKMSQAARIQRISRLAEVQELAMEALRSADLSNLGQSDALENLAVIRMLLADSMKAERLEYGEATEISGEVAPSFTSDDMIQYTKKLEEWRIQRTEKKLPQS